MKETRKPNSALPAVASSAVGKYTVQVQAPGRAALDKPADITAGGATVNFTYGP